MSMTTESTRLHQQYENADSMISDTVDEAYTAVRKAFIRRGFDVSNVDPAEELVAAIFKYLVDSAEPNPLDRGYEIARQKANTQ